MLSHESDDTGRGRGQIVRSTFFLFLASPYHPKGVSVYSVVKKESSGISVGLSRCSRCPIWCADATHTQNLAKSDPATTPAPWTVQWHLKALKSARGLRRNRISPRSFPRDTCDNLRPNRPWRSPRVKNQAIELANSSHWRGRWNAPQSEARREPARSAPEGPARGCAAPIRSKFCVCVASAF